MDASAFQLGQEIHERKVTYILHKDLWDKFSYPGLNISFQNWQSIKYLNDQGTDFSDEIGNIPNDSGGLYLFYTKCQIITGITEYPFYIGRAQLTDGQNLRKRVKEYFQKFSKDDERPKIYKMFSLWGKNLYLAYFPLPDNTTIIDLEKDVINSLLLPMNDLIPDKKIKQAIKAFES
jgi:excinuclease UvrABC nuclease subunit